MCRNIFQVVDQKEDQGRGGSGKTDERKMDNGDEKVTGGRRTD